MGDIVTILMATYNGEKYLADQLESLRNQTYFQWELFIRDDCSKDKTISIIKHYCSADSRIHLVESGCHFGAVGNFGALLEEFKQSDYLMFCDQDDIWEKEKIDLSVKQIKLLETQMGKQYPLLVYSEKQMVDKSLHPLKTDIHNYNETIKELLVQNHIYGCTMIINSALANIASPIPEIAQNHDYWVALNAVVFGTIFKIKVRTIYYRQHENNATGGINNFSVKRKIKNWKKVNALLSETIQQNLSFCEGVSNCGNKDIKKYIEIFSANKSHRIYKAMRMRLHRDTLQGTLRFYYVLYKYPLYYFEKKK